MSNTATALRTYTWDDYRAWPDDERWEIIGGEAYAMSPAPSVRHQHIQIRLAVALFTFLRRKTCRVYTAPIDVKLSDMNVVQPDVVVICRPEQIKPTHIEGAPSLVVEILSDSTEQRDRGIKMRLYALHGVPEVWLARASPALIEVYRLDGESYRLAATYVPPDTLKSPGFPKLRLRLREVFDFPLEPAEKAAMTAREGPPPACGTKRPRRGAKGR